MSGLRKKSHQILEKKEGEFSTGGGKKKDPEGRGRSIKTEKISGEKLALWSTLLTMYCRREMDHNRGRQVGGKRKGFEGRGTAQGFKTTAAGGRGGWQAEKSHFFTRAVKNAGEKRKKEKKKTKKTFKRSIWNGRRGKHIG